MRKLKWLFTIGVLVTFLCLGCSTERDSNKTTMEDPEEEIGPSDSLVDDEEIMNEFQLILNNQPTPYVLISFINANIGKVTTDNADDMIDTLEKLLKNNIERYENQISELDTENELITVAGEEIRFSESHINQLKNEDLKKEIQSLYDNFYQFINLEGQFYLEIDYAKLEQYKNNISEEFQKYLEIKSVESASRSMADAALLISFNELAERMYKAEDYLKVASSAKRKTVILEDYEFKLNAYLKGLPNTPIMKGETNQIREDVLGSYQTTAGKDYEISAIVDDYLEIIESNKQIIDEQVLQEADRLIEKTLITIGKW